MSDRLRREAVQRFGDLGMTRRSFLGTAGAAAAWGVAGGGLPAWGAADQPDRHDPAPRSADGQPESLVKLLYDSLTDTQRPVPCFPWDHVDPERGLLRTRIQNNWHITAPNINDEFFTGHQRDLIRAIYRGMLNPDWVAKVDRQLQDDAGGWGRRQNVAIFGTPGGDKFQFVMTGRHLTLRCDGNSAEHVAFGGPIFHGHEGQGFYEKADHPGNIFWPQAQEANRLYQMLDGRQRQLALVPAGQMPTEEKIAFRGPGFAEGGGGDGPAPGVPVTEMSADQKEQLQKVLRMLIEPYRQSDRDEVVACLAAQGGLDACRLAFYAEADVGGDGVWDNWRLEGPSFVWNFRGQPHVHVWVHVADDPSVRLNAYQDSVL